MFSVSPAEVLTIAVVALLVFGPKRLPEIARKAGKLLRDLRGAANELKTGLEAEYAETLEPLMDIRDTMKSAIAGVDREVSGIGKALDPIKQVTDTMAEAISGSAAAAPDPTRPTGQTEAPAEDPAEPDPGADPGREE